jgi:hypothetical protein
VIRFPASPTTGMHGTELRVQERRTFRLSAPLSPFFPATGSMLQDLAAAFYLLSSTEPVARNGLSLASDGCHLSAASIPGSTFLACYFAPCLKRFPARSALLLHHLRRFQVIRFPASPTTGMHGTELRVQERRTSRLSAPRSPFFPATGSMLRDFAAAFYLLSSTEPDARNGLSLASNGYHLSAASIPGSTFPACYFAPCLKRFPARSARLLHHLRRFAPVNGNIYASGPLQFRLKTRPTASPASTPLQDSYILPDRSVAKFRCPSARLPSTPDFLSLPDAGSISRVGLGSPFLVRYVSGD